MPNRARFTPNEIIKALTILEKKIAALKAYLGALPKGTAIPPFGVTGAGKATKRVGSWPQYDECEPRPPKPAEAQNRALAKLFVDISRSLHK